MKRRKWKIKLGIVAAAFLLSACGTKEEKAEPADLQLEEDTEWAEESEEPADLLLDEGLEMPDETEEPEEELPDWAVAYRDFLTERENLVSLLLESRSWSYDRRGFITGFFLFDLNGDAIPELFLQKDLMADYIYTYTGAQVELRNVIAYDEFAESYFGYDSRKSQAYSLVLDAGTGTDRSTGVAKIALREKTYDMDEGTEAYMISDNGLEWLYSAIYGDMEEWKDAIPWENSVISKEEFSEICINFIPFDFHEITEENIDAYIVADYMDVVSFCSLEAYRKKTESRRQEFWDAVYPCEVKDGRRVIPDHIFKTEGWDEDLYYDLNLLVCYPETKLEPQFEEEWQQIYWEWMKDIEQREDKYGLPIVEGKESGFRICDWKNDFAPTIVIDSGGGSSKFSYCTIVDGKAVNFAIEGKTVNGHNYILLIDNTKYFFQYYDSSNGRGGSWYSGILYVLNNGGAEEIWRLEWEEEDEDWLRVLYSEESGEYDEIPVYVPEYGFQNPFSTFQGQPVSKEDGMAKVDELLGDGAADQLYGILHLDDGSEEAGPLAFAQGGRGSYTWDCLIEGIEAMGK